MSDSRSLFVPLVIIGFFAIGLCAVAMFGVFAGWAFMAAAMFGMMLIGHPRVLLLLYWLWTMVQPLVSYNILSVFIKWTDESLFVLMLAVLIHHHITYRRTFPELTPVRRTVLALVLLAVGSAVINQVPPIFGFHWALQYLRPLALFTYAYYFETPRIRRSFYPVVLIGFFIQLALNLGWLFHVNPLPNRANMILDFAMGSMDACNLVAYFTIAVLCLAIAVFVTAKSALGKAMLTLVMLLSLLQIYLTNTNHAYVLLVIALAAQLWIMRISLQRKIALVRNGIALGAVTLVLAVVIHPDLWGLQSQLLDRDSVKGAWYRLVEGPKAQAYKDVLVSLPEEHAYYAVLGAGPGNFSSMVGRMYRRPLADKYINYTLLSVDVLNATQGFSITSGPHTGILALWGELGPFGVLLFWGLHVYVLLRVWRQYRAGLYEDPTRAALAQGFVPVMLVWILLAVLADYVYLPYLSGGIWIWAALVWSPARNEAPQEEPLAWQKVTTPRLAAGPIR